VAVPFRVSVAPSTLNAAAWPRPEKSLVKIPGLARATFIRNGSERLPCTSTCTLTDVVAELAKTS